MEAIKRGLRVPFLLWEKKKACCVKDGGWGGGGGAAVGRDVRWWWWWWWGTGQKPVELQRLSSPAAATSTSSSRPTGMCVCERVLEAALLSAAHPALQTLQSCRTGEAARRAGGPDTTTTEASCRRAGCPGVN